MTESFPPDDSIRGAGSQSPKEEQGVVDMGPAQPPMVDDEEITLDAEEIAAVKAVLLQLDKTAKTLKLYDVNNPTFQKFLKNLHERFTTFFETYDNFVLKVQAESFDYQGETVSAATGKDSPSCTLFKDGIRRLAFLPGIEEQELYDFITVVNTNFESSDNIDDDVVTLLWKSNLVNINYTVVDAFLDRELEENLGERVSDVVDLVYATDEGLETLERVRMTQEDVEIMKNPDVVAELQDGSASAPMKDATIVELEELEIMELQQEVAMFSAYPGFERMPEVMESILLQDPETGELQGLFDTLFSLVDYFLVSGHFDVIQKLVLRCRELKPLLEEDEAKAQLFEQIVDRLGSKRAISMFGDYLNEQGTEIDRKNIFSFIVLLNPNAIPNLADLFEDVQKVQNRKLVCDSLTVLSRDHVDVLSQCLRDQRWFVVRNIVYILGKIGSAAAQKAALKVKDHTDHRVRQEVIMAMGKAYDPSVRELLLGYLDDPDTHVRQSALQHMMDQQDRAVVDSLVKIMQDKSFANRSMAEKKKFFLALPKLSPERSVSFFTEILQKFSFGTRKTEEMRLCAVFGLGEVGTKQALDVLRKQKERTLLSKGLKESIGEIIIKLQTKGFA